MRRWVVIGILLTLVGRAAGQTADQAAAPPPDESQLLLRELRSGSKTDRQSAIDDIHDLTKHPPKSIELAAKDLLPAMIGAGDFVDVEPIAMAVLKDRPFDPTAVDIAQRSRATALLSLGKYADALVEAKSYYNVALLNNSAQAISILKQLFILNGDPATAVRFMSQQAPPPASATTQPVGDTVLGSIKVDGSPYAAKLKSLGTINAKGTGSYSKLMGRGNLLLLSDRLAEAREAFEAACRASDPAHPKDLHEGVEGVARAIRAESGNIAPANAFLIALRGNDLTASAKLVGDTGSASAEDIAKAAQAAHLADLSPMFDSPPDGNP